MITIEKTEPFSFDPSDWLDDPYPTYRRLRDDYPVYRDEETGHYILSRFDDVAGVANDVEGYANASLEKVTADPAGPHSLDLLESDPPRHDQMREVIQARFSPKALTRLEPMIGSHAERLLRAIADDPDPDLAGGFTWPLPLAVLSSLVGVPEDVRPALLSLLHSTLHPDEHGKMRTDVRLSRLLVAFFADLVDERRADPRDDIATDLARSVDDGSLSLHEAADLASFAWEGVMNSANFLGHALFALTENPDQRAILRTSDARGIKVAVEEFLRSETPVQLSARYPRRDVELRGVPIPMGSTVTLLFGAANRDERRFPDPDRLELTRPPTRNVAFGMGIHFCIAAPIIRVMSRIALPMVVRTLPTFLVDGEVVRDGDASSRGILRFPVRFANG